MLHMPHHRVQSMSAVIFNAHAGDGAPMLAEPRGRRRSSVHQDDLHIRLARNCTQHIGSTTYHGVGYYWCFLIPSSGM